MRECFKSIPEDTPVLCPLEDRRNWLLVKDLVVEIEGGKKLYIPAGSTTDFASIPRFLWNIFPPYDKGYLIPSIVHDFFYRTGHGTRKRADKIFYRLMLKYGTPKWKALLFYLVVRIFGGKAWQGESS